jgi:hypothetical protein
MVRRFYEEQHKEGFYLVSDILVWLDEREDAPAAWLRWLSQYQTRYAMVRNVCVSLARTGYLDTRQELNSLNKPATSYQRARDLDAWDVQVAGDDAESVTDLVTGWLRANPKALRGIRAISITRKPEKQQEYDVKADGASGRGARAKAPKRSRR